MSSADELMAILDQEIQSAPSAEDGRMPRVREPVDEQVLPEPVESRDEVQEAGWPPQPSARHRVAWAERNGPGRGRSRVTGGRSSATPTRPSRPAPAPRSAPVADRDPIAEIHVLWISEGMSCDGDTISITAAEKPSIEDVVLGTHPGAAQGQPAQQAAVPDPGRRGLPGPVPRGRSRASSEPFILVIEGSIPNQNIIEGDGYWTSFGNDPDTGQPLTVNWWIDRLAPKAWAVMAVGTCATYGGIHAMAGNPTGCHGAGRLPGMGLRSARGLPIVNVPGCPVQPENFMETLTWMLYHAAGTAPPPPLDGMLRPEWIFDTSVHDGCDRAAYYEQGELRRRLQPAEVPVKLGCWGPVVNCNVPKRGWIGGVGGCPNVGGICIGCTMPGFPDCVHAVHGRAGRGRALLRDLSRSTATSSTGCVASPAWR